MAALRNGSKCSHTTCMLRFFTVSRLALNPNLIFEMGSYYLPNLMKLNNVYNLTTLDNKDFHSDRVMSEFE